MDPVAAGGRVQPDERVGVAQLPARLVSSVDEQYAGVGIGDQRVGEGEAARTHAIDEVVGGQPHVTAPLSPRRDTGSHGSSPQERCSG